MKQFEEILISQIVEHPDNPRKTFDEAALNELAASIKEKGVIQPIVVRKFGIVISKKKDSSPAGYQVICGARRFRASKIAEQETIPCIIRELSDEEALELMLIENLQRKDVDPFEEASGYQALVNQSKKSIEEVAAKMGVSASHVARRLRLNALHKDFKAAFSKNEITIGVCLEIARHADQVQKDLADLYKQKWERRNFATVKDIKEIIEENILLLLDKAPFKRNDAELLPKAGACTTCPFNTGTQGVLFEDTKKAYCQKKECYDKKVELHQAQQLQKIITKNPEIMLVAYSHNMSSEEVEMANKVGTVTSLQGYRVIADPGKEPQKPKKSAYNLENYESQEELDADFKEDMEQYQEELTDWKDEVREYKEAEKTAIKAYDVYSGKYIYIKPVTLSRASQSGIDVSEVSDTQKEAMKEELEKKDKRNKELMIQAMYADMYHLINVEENDKNLYKETTAALHKEETKAIHVLMLTDISHDLPEDLAEELEKQYGFEAGYGGDTNDLYYKVISSCTFEQLNRICRTWIVSKLHRNASGISNYSSLVRSTCEIALVVNPDAAQPIIGKHTADFNKKQQKIMEKLSSLSPDPTPKKKGKGFKAHLTESE